MKEYEFLEEINRISGEMLERKKNNINSRQDIKDAYMLEKLLEGLKNCYCN